MSIYDSYRNRVYSNSYTSQEELINSTKKQVYDNLVNSPSMSVVEQLFLTKNPDGTLYPETRDFKPSIISDVDVFYKRKILFLPDTKLSLGAYIKHKDKTYLITKINDNDIYAEATMEYCNVQFLVKGKEEKIIDGLNELKKPNYVTIKLPDYVLPCVVTSKQYSALDNSQMPLPTGAIYVYIPYHKDIDIYVNYEFLVHGDNYKITSISKTMLMEDEFGNVSGVLEIRGQRRQNDE